jgi:hypothetical protein
VGDEVAYLGPLTMGVLDMNGGRDMKGLFLDEGPNIILHSSRPREKLPGFK